MKKMLGIIGLAFILSVSLTGNASAGAADKALQLVKTAENYTSQLATYLASKDYNDINSSSAKTAIKALCKNGCGRFTCGKSGVKQKVGLACKKLCPANDVKNCVKKM